MQHQINNDNNLLIILDEEEMKALLEESRENDSFKTNDFMYDLFEPLICNSDLEWLSPEQTGDLTDAPILGVTDPVTNTVVERWAFMSYETTSPQEQMLDSGMALFIS